MPWTCKNCHLTWYYPIEECIYCRGVVTETKPAGYTVVGSTEVFVPSLEHSQTPYSVLLLKDDEGNHYIRKSFEHQPIGHWIDEETREETKSTIGVVGTGIMGKGIAQLIAHAGHKVIFNSRTRESLDKSTEKIGSNLLKAMSVEDKDNVLNRIELTTDLTDLAAADLIIESIVEEIDVKKRLFRKLDEVCPRTTVLATNTSSLSIDEIASVVQYPDRVIGMHFFSPAPKVHLVEIARGKYTSQETVEFVKNVAKQFSKTPIVMEDSPCFIVKLTGPGFPSNSGQN